MIKFLLLKRFQIIFPDNNDDNICKKQAVCYLIKICLQGDTREKTFYNLVFSDPTEAQITKFNIVVTLYVRVKNVCKNIQDLK